MPTAEEFEIFKKLKTIRKKIEYLETKEKDQYNKESLIPYYKREFFSFATYELKNFGMDFLGAQTYEDLEFVDSFNSWYNKMNNLLTRKK